MMRNAHDTMITRAPKLSVTIIIPAYNEEANITRLTRQVLDEPWNAELYLDRIIIVDDCSTDSTGIIVAGLARDDTRVSAMRHDQRKGKNAGIREGIVASTSDITVILDADILLTPECLTKTIELIGADPSLTAASCVNEPLPARSWRERASRFQALLITELRFLGQDSLLRLWAIRTSAFVGLTLPDDVADDLYIMRWLSWQGYHFALCRDATIFFRTASGLRDFAKQTLRAWRAVKDIDNLIPNHVAPTKGRGPTKRAAARAIRREPFGFLLYVVWRGIVTVTPTTLWLHTIALSKHDVSTSTKDLGG